MSICNVANTKHHKNDRQRTEIKRLQTLIYTDDVSDSYILTTNSMINLGSIANGHHG